MKLFNVCANILCIIKFLMFFKCTIKIFFKNLTCWSSTTKIRINKYFLLLGFSRLFSHNVPKMPENANLNKYFLTIYENL